MDCKKFSIHHEIDLTGYLAIKGCKYAQLINCADRSTLFGRKGCMCFTLTLG